MEMFHDGDFSADVNECEENNPCDSERGECFNYYGGYLCSCKDGYKLNSNNRCTSKYRK